MATRKRKPAGALARFHPIVREWFVETLGAPSPPQEQGWPAIATGGHTLLLAPTGTGKTLAAFLHELDALITEGSRGPLANAVHVLYVSPLKALNNDVQRNLERPLDELRLRFEQAGESFPEIRVAVRTGDTPAAARARMLRKTPHILITTPESLHIMLTSPRARTMFSGLRVVIVDEIHAVAGTKRGAHLALAMERLHHLMADRPPQRIGLSATQRPLEEIAKFLSGSRSVHIIDCGLVKQMATTVQSPVTDLAHVGGTIWTAVAPLVLQHVRRARTTLVFVNNRAQAERVAARVNALAEEEVALPYHGSLSRERRFGLEKALKAGELKALVSTSSLELGIDIGSVDVVLQLQSPKRVAAGLQRVGRAGHSLGAVSRGVFVPTFRDDALEIVAIVRAMRDGDVEPTRVVQNALDVLAQTIVAIVSVEDDWTADALYELVRRAYPYHSLTRTAFDEVVAMLSGKYSAELAAELEPRIMHDPITGVLSAPRGSRMLAITNGGTIPDRGLYAVQLPDRTRLGELDEEFVHETRIGDVFQLGSSTWRVGAIEHDRVIVTPAPGQAARMPFWHGEFMARSSHLTKRIGALRRELDDTRTRERIEQLVAEYGADEATVTSLVEYVHQQRAATGTVPDDRILLLEQFRDETGSLRIVLHAPVGGRVTAPWGMALAQRVREWIAGRARPEVPRKGRAAGRKGQPAPRDPDALMHEVQVQTTDDGIMLRLPDMGVPVPESLFRTLTYDEAERRVLQEVGSSALFGARFRMNAARALLLPRGNPRRRMPLWLQRLKSLDLLQTVRQWPSFPILVETYRDVLQDAFDMEALRAVLDGIGSDAIAMRRSEGELPSPFASSLQFGFVIDWMYADDAPRAETRAAKLSLDRALLDELLGGAGADEETLTVLRELLARRRGEAEGRKARDADELAVLVDRAGDLTRDELAARLAPVEARRGDPLRELLARGRVLWVELPTSAGPERRLVLTESYARYCCAFGSLDPVYAGVEETRQLARDVVPEALRASPLTAKAAHRELLARFAALAEPFSVADVRRRYDIPAAWVERQLREWEKGGVLVRGHFSTDPDTSRAPDRWVSRRLLEEARRRELARARRAVEAVDLAALTSFLQRWQHLLPSERLQGPEAASDAMRQMLGVPRPPESWERDHLPARVDDFEIEELTRLAGGGSLVWVGEAAPDASGAPRVARVRFLERGTGRAWLRELPSDEAQPRSANALRVRAALREHGASFFADLQAATSLGTPALRDALRELVAFGEVTNDTVDALRDIARWKPMEVGGADDPDPTRWLPADFVRSRPVVQRRPNLRRLPKWRRPDKPGGERQWPGRWSLVRTPGLLGPEAPEEALAEVVARQWLARYGVVSRDWWRRERPAVSWRAVYMELRRLEYRGEVRRGWFVRGLAGIQFALPEAVEMLREAAADPGGPLVVMSAGDPANAHTVGPPMSGTDDPRDALGRPRGSGGVLVTRAGRVMLAAEGRGKRVRVAAEADAATVRDAAALLVQHLLRAPGGRRVKDLVIRSIDGAPAATSPHAESFRAAGFRGDTKGLRYHARV